MSTHPHTTGAARRDPEHPRPVAAGCGHPSDWVAEPLVSIMVLNWNGEGFLRRCVESLYRDVCPHVELVVVDNASTDRSVSMMKQEFPTVPVIVLPTNLSHAAGRNAAVPYLKGRFIVFLDNDVTVEKGWLHPLVTLMLLDPSIGISTPKIRLSALPGRLQGVGGYLKLWTGNRELGYGRPDDFYAPGEVIEPFYGFGAALVVRRDVFEHVGGFDDRMFPTGTDDLDLAWRARLAGYRVVCVTDAVVNHYLSGARGVLDPHTISFHTYHLLRTMAKCLSWPNLLHAMPAYSTFAIASGAATSVLSRDPRVFTAIVSALGRFALSIPEVRHSRAATQRLRTAPDSTVLRSQGFGLCETPAELWRKLQIMRALAKHHREDNSPGRLEPDVEA